GERDLVPAADPARQDRPAQGRAPASPAEQGGGGPPEAAGPRPADGDPRGQGDAAGSRVSHVYCLECGFQNPEAANYCARCGALLEKEEPSGETTVALSPEDVGDDGLLGLEGLEGPALVVRSGGGRAGEHFSPGGPRTTIG